MRLLNRNLQSWCCANIILKNELVEEFKIYCWKHPKVKSNYRLANLFLLNKGLRFSFVENPVKGLNMDNLIEYWNS